MPKFASFQWLALASLCLSHAPVFANEREGNFRLSCYEQSQLEAFNVLNAAALNADRTLAEEWGEHDANDPALRPQLQKISNLNRTMRAIRVDLANGNGYRAQGALYKALELMADPDVSERAFAKPVLSLSFALDDVGIDPGLSAEQIDRLVLKAEENAMRVRAGRKTDGLTDTDRVLSYAARKGAYLRRDWERLRDIIAAQENGVLSSHQKVDLAAGYVWLHDLSRDESYLKSAEGLLRELIDDLKDDRCSALVVGRAATNLARILTGRIVLRDNVTNESMAEALDVASLARSRFGGLDVPSYRGYAFEVSAELLQAVIPFLTPRGAATGVEARAARYAEIARSLR